ncbi:serine hydrolase [Candidatus Raskinella chloraquaticus]|jgi:D-alanyl-D-alanine carboxypeptidase|uniref:serine hydrolase n=1 Tax=Candidatus Raskinella chloraquaticus TaxID=1951219 RepID=UPI0036734C8A
MHIRTKNAVGSALSVPLWLAAATLLAITAIQPSAAAEGRLASIVIDANSGDVLQQNNADKQRYPASLTKMMTLYLLFEQIEAGNYDLNSRLSVSANAARQPPTRLGVKPGGTITVEAAIMSLITRSANDVSVVIAENIDGDVDSFARRMTTKAHQIGMSRTVFRNPNGLPNSQQVTTARDMATLGRSLFERFPKFTPYFARQSFTYQGRVIRNHNKLLGRVDGVDGIKTGYTRASGFNLVTSMRRNGRHLVAAVLGAPSGPTRDNHMRHLVKAHATQLAAKKTSFSLAMRSKAPAAPEKIQVAAASSPPPAKKPVNDDADAAPEKSLAALAQAALAKVPDSAPAIAAPQQTAAPPPVRASAVAPPPWQVAGTQVEQVQDIRPRISSVLQWRSGAAPARDTSSTERQADKEPTGSSLPRAATLTGWVVQIAATNSENEALQLLKDARDAARKPLSSAKAVTERVAKGPATLYRARFAGFADKQSAERACAALKREDYSCLTLKL